MTNRITGAIQPKFSALAAAATLALALSGAPVLSAEPAAAAPPSTAAGETISPEVLDTELGELIKRGATMEEIARVKNPRVKTPAEAIRALKIGNARFFSGTARRPELSAMERRAQILGQTPFAVILGCSDSRVPLEIVYDQGLGEIFAIRVAGNFIAPSTAGSIEYAVEHLKSRVVVVMGHEGCGAVQAAMLTEAQRRAEPENVQIVLDAITPAVRGLPPIRDRKALMREAVIANVRQQVHMLKQNRSVQEAIRRNQIAVIGAFYEITSGAVDFLETAEELRLSNAPTAARLQK